MVNLMERLEALEARYDELQVRLSQPETLNDMDNWRKLMKEHADMEPLMTAFNEYRNVVNNIAEAKEMLEDPDMRDMAKEELAVAEPRLEELEHELQLLLLPKDPNDDKNVIIEIRAGVGGEEGALFAAELARMYTHYADSRGWKTEELDANLTELGGVKEMSLMITGQGAYSRLKYESGAHRVQRVPETESGGRIHTSAATVAVMPEVDDVEIDINMNDVRIDTYRAGGAGGQHVNRTDSAVRMTHIPTGIVVQCQNERSQIQNREQAMRMLRAKLWEKAMEEQQNEVASFRKNQVGSGDRSERIRTYNYPQGRVTDHRINVTLYKLPQFLNGDLDEMLNPLILADQTARLEEQNG